MNTIHLDHHRHSEQGRAPEWDAARHALLHAAPPDRVEAALMRAYLRHHAPWPWYRRLSLDALTSWAGVAATGCMLALLAAALQGGGAQSPALQNQVAATGAEDGFLALVPAERIATAAHPQLKRADLTRQTLVRLGIPIAADAPNEMIHAELLMAATGEPLAIRLAVN